MFKLKTTQNPNLPALDEAIASVYSDMAGFTSDHEEYDAASKQLVRLMQLREEIAPTFRITPDVLVNAGASVLGILMILNFERAGVVASKALGFVLKSR